MKKKTFKDFALYIVVGVAATVCEWLLFWLFDGVLGINYLVSTVIAYTVSTFVNWVVGRLLVFKKPDKKLATEIGEVYLAAAVGVLLNMVFMVAFVKYFGMNETLSKMISTAIVFLYNFFARKLVIYNKNKEI